MRLALRGRTLLVAGLVVGATATVSGIAYASIPSSDGTIHACYSPNGSKGTNGTPLNILDRDQASCSRGQQEITWSQTGPPGLKGDKGDTGDKGDKGDTGAAGSGNAFTNYGDGLHDIGEGLTQTVSSVTLPPGKYTLSATVAVVKATDDHTHVQCAFVSAGTLHGNVALAALEGTFGVKMPLIGDVTTTAAATAVFLRCTALDADASAAGDIIALQVGTITPSE